MSVTERVIDDLNTARLILCNPQALTPAMCIKIGQAITSALALLKEQQTEIERLTETLRKKQHDVDMLCRENSKLKHRIYDVPKEGDGE